MEQQALLTATVQNLKRYLQAQTRVLAGAAALRATLPAVPCPLVRWCQHLRRSFLRTEAALAVPATELLA